MAKYINREIYLEKRGIDLNIEFANVATDNPSGVVDIILTEIEEELLDELATYDNDGKTYNPDIMTRALVYQVDSLRENGNLSRDREYHGNIICPNAYRILKDNGYCNPRTAGRKPYWGAY